MSDDPWSGVARPFSSDWDTRTPLEKAEEALYEEWRRQHPRSLKEYDRTITVDANFNVVATSGYEEKPMGREIRRVPRGWQHPRNARGEYQPLYDREFEPAAKEWKDGLAAWEAGAKSEDCEYWEYEDGPPDREYYRPKWTEEPTCFQMYETVSEGTPVSPVFESEEDLVQWLVSQGRSEHSARTFVEKKWAPSMIVTVPRDGSPARIASNLEAFDLPIDQR